MIDTLTSALSTFLPESVTAIAAPALQGAGIGALSSLITGQKPGMSALIGGGLGAAYGAFGNNGPLSGAFSNIFGGGGDPSVVGSGPSNDPYQVGGASKGPAPTTENGWSDVGATPQNAGSLAANSAATANGGGGGGIGGINKTALALGALAALGSAMSKPQQGTWTTPGAAQNPNIGPTFNQPLNTNVPGRTPTNPWPTGSGPNYWAYGGPEATYFTNNSASAYGLAEGGRAPQGALSMADGGQREVSTANGDHYVQGPGDGQADRIPAALSDGEFIVDATTVSRLGNGSNRKGAEVLEDMRRKIATASGSDRVVQKKIDPGALERMLGGRAA